MNDEIFSVSKAVWVGDECVIIECDTCRLNKDGAGMIATSAPSFSLSSGAN